MPPPAVSKRLGHSNVYVTATVYSHALPADEIAAADTWSKAMKKAAENPSPNKKSAKILPILQRGNLREAERLAANGCTNAFCGKLTN